MSTRQYNSATKNKDGMAINLLICQHVAQHGPCSSGQLFWLFAGASHGQSTEELKRKRKLFSSRLYNLSSWGRLRNTAPKGEDGCYVLGVSPLAADVPAPPDEAAPPPVWVGKKVPPNQYDVMRAPVYAPPPMASVRPGADDHLRLKSLGHFC